MIAAPAARSSATAAASSTGVEDRAVLGRHIASIKNVFDTHRYAVKRAEGGVREAKAIGLMCLAQCIRGIEKGPCANRVLKLLDPGNAPLDQIDGSQLARPDSNCRLACA